MPWLINNSTGCKYWTYNHIKNLLKRYIIIISNTQQKN